MSLVPDCYSNLTKCDSATLGPSKMVWGTTDGILLILKCAEQYGRPWSRGKPFATDPPRRDTQLVRSLQGDQKASRELSEAVQEEYTLLSV